jgi:tetratricopeptide (TPR) repeat protein
MIATLAIAALSLPGTLSAQDPAERLKVANDLEFNDGKRSEAAAIYRDVLVKSPANFEAHLGLGRILVVDGRIAEGRQHLEKALAAASNTQRNPALSTLAISYVFEGNGAAAAKFYQQVFDSQLKANAMSPAANTANALARAFLETGDHPFVLGLLAQAHEQKNEMATAKELYARVLARPGFSLQMALARPLAARRLAGR